MDAVDIEREGGRAAFPRSMQDGLTKREYFAALAMQGLISSHTGPVEPPQPKTAADYAVRCADALIAELNEEGNELEGKAVSKQVTLTLKDVQLIHHVLGNCGEPATERLRGYFAAAEGMVVTVIGRLGDEA
jgi:hypothetical protein